MEKLKTLNDLKYEVYDKELGPHEAFIKIRKEAIKWVKNNLKLSYKDKMYPRARIEIRWIKHFFNITEEDTNADKEVVGIVDNLNNERVATLIKCKQVEKSIPKGCGKYLGGMGIGYSVCGRLDNGGELLLCDKCKQVDKGEQK